MKYLSNYTNLPMRFLFLISAFALFTSCDNVNKKNQTAEVVNQSIDSINLQKSNVLINESDAKFLVDAAQINYHEIVLGNLLKYKSKTSHVVELAKMMIAEHTKSLDDLKKLAAKKNIKLPSPVANDQIDDYNKLVKESGNMLDKDYANLMVAGHKEAITKFENAVDNSTDSDIKTWALSVIPTLKMHLQHSEECQKKCDKK